MTREEALKYRSAIETGAQSLSDEQALSVVYLFASWESEHDYTIGERALYNEVLYSCLQDHTSQNQWTPDVTPSLWARVLIPSPDIIPEWVQPDSTNPYMTGDKVTHNGSTWISIVDNNVWEPGVYGWELIP